MKLFKSLLQSKHYHLSNNHYSNTTFAFSSSSHSSSSFESPSEFFEKLKEGQIESKLISKTKLNHDTFIYEFSLPDNIALNYTPSQHLKFFLEVEQITEKGPMKQILSRRYTPISCPDIKGKFDVLIKIYRKNTHPKYPHGGIMTQALENLQIGQTIKISGFGSRLLYLGNSEFMLNDNKKKVSHIGLIAGGSGITPSFQILRSIYKNKADPIQASLLYANKTEQNIIPATQEDIVLKEQLDKFTDDPRIKIHYVLDKAPTTNTSWKGYLGYINPQMFEQTLPIKHNSIFGYSGPKSMNTEIVNILNSFGINSQNYTKF